MWLVYVIQGSNQFGCHNLVGILWYSSHEMNIYGSSMCLWDLQLLKFLVCLIPNLQFALIVCYGGLSLQLGFYNLLFNIDGLLTNSIYLHAEYIAETTYGPSNTTKKNDNTEEKGLDLVITEEKNNMVENAGVLPLNSPPPFVSEKQNNHTKIASSSKSEGKFNFGRTISIFYMLVLPLQVFVFVFVFFLQYYQFLMLVLN